MSETAKRIGVMMQLDQPFKRHVLIYAGVLDYEKKHPDFKVFVDEWADRAVPAKCGGPTPYDGVLGRIGAAGAERCRQLGVPAVNVWLSSPAKNLPGVFPDYMASGRAVAEHLLSRGFRNLAALLQTGDKATGTQAEGIRAFLECEGVGQWRGTITIDSPEIFEQWRRGLEALDRWMDTWTLPLGVLVLDPSWARVIIERAHDRCWRVPDQIAIVCSHNDGLQCERPDPGLTAVEFPYEQIGYEAAKMLDALIDTKRQGAPPPTEAKTLILPMVGIVARHSTDFFAVDDALVGRALRYIAAHLNTPLSVTDVAKAVGVARRTLDAWFSKALGATVATEIMRLRIERVKRELIAGKDSVETIALRTGFASIRTLNDQFKRVTGMSPTAFREGAHKR